MTFTIDAGTAAGTFTSKAQFYKSDNTTDGPTTGPLITVVEPTDFSVANTYATGGLLTNELDVGWTVTNNGPGSATAATVQTTISVSSSTMVLTYYDAFANFGCAIGSGNVVGNCSLTTVPLGAGGAGLISSTYQLNLLATGSVTLTTTVTSPYDTNAANNSASVDLHLPARPHLQLPDGGGAAA